MPGIAHIILNVSDFSRSEIFYDRLLFRLGFSTNYREETAGIAIKSYVLDEHNLWIRSDRTASHLSFVRDTGLDHLALFARSKYDVDELYQELRAAEVIITRPPAFYHEYSLGYYAFYFRDPDGIPMEIVNTSPLAP